MVLSLKYNIVKSLLVRRLRGYLVSVENTVDSNFTRKIT